MFLGAETEKQRKEGRKDTHHLYRRSKAHGGGRELELWVSQETELPQVVTVAELTRGAKM